MISDLKELEKLFKLCRKQGISEITIEGITTRFGDLPTKASPQEQTDEVPTDGIPDEELAFYHLGNT